MSDISTFGAYSKIKVPTKTYSPAQVQACADKAEISDLPVLPDSGTALARAVNCLVRECAASIEFPAGSRFASWTEDRPAYKVVKGTRVQVGTRQVVKSGRNPYFALKLTWVKKASTDTSVTCRVNIACKEKHAENMGHVLNVTHTHGQALTFTPGSDIQAYLDFGSDLECIIRATFARFSANFDDTDMRNLLDREFGKIRAMRVLEKLNCFVAPEHVDRAGKISDFAQGIGCDLDWSDLAHTPRNRDNLLKQLTASIFADMDTFEKELDRKLNTPTVERKRGEKQRERMHTTQVDSLNGIMALPEYYAELLGCVSAEILDRKAKLLKKVGEILTKDFDKAGTEVAADEIALTDADVEIVTDAADPFSAA